MRFARRVPGEAFWSPRPLAQRMYAREPEPEAPRLVCGDTVKISALKTRRIHGTAEPSPNAPLLIRLNTHPYEMSRGYPKRVEGRQARDRDARARSNTEPLMRVASGELHRAPANNPIRAIDHIPNTPSVPTIDEWLQGDDRC